MSLSFFWITKWSLVCFAVSLSLILCGPIAFEHQLPTMTAVIFFGIASPFNFFDMVANTGIPVFLQPIGKVALFSASIWGLVGAIFDLLEKRYLRFLWPRKAQTWNTDGATPIMIVASCLSLCASSVAISLPRSIEDTVLLKLRSTNPDVRRTGLVEAYRLGMNRHFWKTSLQDNANPGHAKIAARKLVAIEIVASDACEMAIGLFAADHDEKSRLWAIQAIGSLRLLPDKARPAVVEAIESSNADLRLAGLVALENFGDTLQIDSQMIRKWLATAKPDFRALLIATVTGGFAHWPDAGTIFADYLDDENAEVRNYALLGMIELGLRAQPHRVQVGMRLFDKERQVKLSAIRTVIAIKTNDPNIIGQLKTIASQDSIEDVRNAALFAVNSLP